MGELIFESIPNNPALDGLASVVPDIVYSHAGGKEIKLTLIVPQGSRIPENPTKYHCIVFVQGSAWTFPDVTYELPQMSEFARNGYIVAMVTHRSALDGFKAPAFLKDVKTAIRFLRANAENYKIDPDRIGIWGTSSGGNTALMVGLTGDDPLYRTDEHSGFSDKVKTVVECFGPADVPALFEGLKERADHNPNDRALLYGLLGADPVEQRARMQLMNPSKMVVKGKDYPPFLLIHGDKDPLVPYSQSEEMAVKLAEADIPTRLIKVEGAEHEGTFWSGKLFGMIADYLKQTL